VDNDKSLSVCIACDAEHYDESTAENLEIEAGQISFHDIYMVHRSAPNTSGNRRAAVVMRIMPATSYFDIMAPTAKKWRRQKHDISAVRCICCGGMIEPGRNNLKLALVE